MARYLVEVYASRRVADLVEAVARAHAAATAVSSEGVPVRHVRATLVPDDEICFHIFEGPSLESVDAVVRRAGLVHARIVSAMDAVVRPPRPEEGSDLGRGEP
ncbi:MAG: hypothetical protein KatS3mg065_0301 [Chloroflexota bacterium]|nr:MAG: hypothetical protein KatS3mg065_0301 [Chloroflexota bacterium]